MDGDWYARGMYEPGNKHYKYHLEHYGHPSEFGYKDIIPLWKAEKWDPDRLMALYKKAGARYFVSMGSHHDNFFLWNSKLHQLERRQHGAEARRGRRLAEGGAEARPAVRRLGAPGRQLHLVPEPATAPTRPARRPACPTTAPTRSTRTSTTSRPSPDDKGWYSNNPQVAAAVVRPDQGTGGQLPARPALHRRRRALRQRGRPQHDRPPLQRQTPRATAARSRWSTPASRSPKAAWVEDLERGVMAEDRSRIPGRPTPRSATGTTTANWKFRPVSWVIHMLVDIVSKNGNLLLNVVQRPDGSLDPKSSRCSSSWPPGTPINGEAIYGTRPWLVYGEGRGQGQGRPLQGGLRLHRPGHPLHHQGRRRSTPSRWAGRRTASSSIRSLAKPAGRERQRITDVEPARPRRQARVEADRRRPRRDAARRRSRASTPSR